jgi:hypothetical protein
MPSFSAGDNMKKRTGILILLIILCQIPIVVTNIPFLRYRAQTVSGTEPTFVHGGHVDYFTYLTFIREAKDGAWSVPALYTTEPSRPSSVYVFYIALGKIAAIAGLEPAAAYHLARIIMTEMYAVSLSILIFVLAGPVSAVPVILVALAATTPLDMFGVRVWNYSEAWRWWYNLDPLFRFDAVPPCSWPAPHLSCISESRRQKQRSSRSSRQLQARSCFPPRHWFWHSGVLLLS